MRPGTDVTGLIRPDDPTKIHEIDYMLNPARGIGKDWAVCFVLV